jgi:4'-phosphopantetheinyl transferase
MTAYSSSHQTSDSQASLTPRCPTDHIDIWKVSLGRPVRAGCEAGVLSPDEIARANRFHFDKDRIHFTQCRLALRSVLAAYIAVPASEIRFEYLNGGKPQLVADQNPRGIQFNVSHSGNMALLAIGDGYRVGVDIEKIRGDVDAIALAERFFSIRERNGLRALPDDLRVLGFFACWTRKEAFVKATGEGLSFPLADFSVTTHPDCDPELEEVRGNAEAHKQWFLADLSIVDGYRATVAVEGTPSRTATYSWN